MSDERYMAIPPSAIVPGALPEFKIYFRSSQGIYTLWAAEGNKVSARQLAKLLEGGLKEVFVDLDEQFKYEEYLESNLDRILDNPAGSIDQKAAIFSKISMNVVKNAFDVSFGTGSLGPNTLRRVENLVKNALLFLSETKSLKALADMIGHDYQTYEHATKVLWYAIGILGDNPNVLEIIEPSYPFLDDDQKKDVLRQCGVAALLHDVGKVFIPPEILNKNGPLTDVEWEIMKRHPLTSLAMLVGTEVPDFVRKAAMQHHEDFNGRGYPMGLLGLNINILARVLRIVDTFDAMTSRRPYKEPMPPMKALKIMVGTPLPVKTGEEGSVGDDRDKGMLLCFDEELLRKFILYIGKMKLSE
jgi:HD-GYP domain-containing protein (c-di-GMP phosphodiesterase class II)